ncbi:hypothetical protein MNEG_16488 [Monoraphidium neglectum]|uniref:Uncharacterized protein n=1 Tax=Monoraphidium neglectum TaxID=145388 RepID=A0A0D2LN62_9CHLO|nr:hypothetical protein MNEG_16488 [Monoraphidium neglectum]KIY91476.1 hypothetical protein MNEG_16488 [Monoraphidium neglectum]|eukprot:XP_013890496.1 hypothetical protein MNEG_16488 [Monoraphidium neglectum]
MPALPGTTWKTSGIRSSRRCATNEASSCSGRAIRSRTTTQWPGRASPSPRFPPPRRAAPRAAAAPDAPQPLALRSARQSLLSLLDGGAARDDAEVAAAVDTLIRENPSLTPGLDTPEVGVGVWEVVLARGDGAA